MFILLIFIAIHCVTLIAGNYYNFNMYKMYRDVDLLTIKMTKIHQNSIEICLKIIFVFTIHKLLLFYLCILIISSVKNSVFQKKSSVLLMTNIILLFFQ